MTTLVLAILGVSLLGANDVANASGTTASCLEFANTFHNGSNIPRTDEPIKSFDGPPAPVDAWFNSTDIDERGTWDPSDHRSWKFAQEFARLLCYTSDNADVTAAYYFIRATNASNGNEFIRPESDSETVFKALEWLTKNRGVKVNVLLDNTNTCTTLVPAPTCTNIMTKIAREAVEKRFAKFAPGSSNINYCINGCFNTARYGVYPNAVEHEKFWTVSDTDFPGEADRTNPLVISTSANLARRQTRSYRQEASSIYGDTIAYRQFKLRFDGMKSCAIDSCALLGDRRVLNTDNPDLATAEPKNPLALVQEGDRRIWVDPILRHTTDSGRGTAITFSPGRAADAGSFDVYINQFDNVDCSTDGKIRLAMFKLTDGKATKMASVLKSLKSRGCDVKMLMTSVVGQTSISSAVRSTLDSAKVDYKCTIDALHTKLILIGPKTGNLGRVLTGTQNMSVAGQLYNEEHVITFDAQKAAGEARNAIRAVYDVYQREWTELSQGASKGNCGTQ